MSKGCSLHTLYEASNSLVGSRNGRLVKLTPRNSSRARSSKCPETKVTPAGSHPEPSCKSGDEAGPKSLGNESLSSSSGHAQTPATMDGRRVDNGLVQLFELVSPANE